MLDFIIRLSVIVSVGCVFFSTAKAEPRQRINEPIRVRVKD